jgi:hypothetical protein
MSDEPKCGARLEVTIRNTTHSFRCHRLPDHAERTHRTPEGSEWQASERKPKSKFFTAPGICANCSEKVPLGGTHVDWVDAGEGYWNCEPKGRAR